MFTFIGIDVSKNKFDICWLRDSVTGKRKNKVFKNTAQGHIACSKWLLSTIKQPAENMVVVVEPTGVYHERLIHVLHDAGFKIRLVNPGKASQYAKSLSLVHKTDKNDAYMLSQYGHAQQSKIKCWEPECPEVRELKVLLRRLDALETDLQREMNRMESSEFSLSSRRVVQSLQAMIDTLTSEIATLQQDIDDHIDQYPNLKKSRVLLESIKGIGSVMSRELVYLFSAKEFKTAKQVAAYCGLIPKLKESGNFKGRTTLSKTGPSRIRAKLYMAAISASQYNPQIKAQQKRLLESGKTKMQALGAAMRKLIQICFGVFKHQSEYQPQMN